MTLRAFRTIFVALLLSTVVAIGCKKEPTSPAPAGNKPPSTAAATAPATAPVPGPMPAPTPATADSYIEPMQAPLAQDIAAIDAAKAADDLKPFIARSGPVFRAAVARLAQLGDPQSIALLGQAFDTTQRIVGAGAENTGKVAAIEALAATGKPDARAQIERIVDQYLAEKPRADRNPHIYDPQYFEVIIAGLKGLSRFDDPAIDARLTTVESDESRFYSLREAAYEGLLSRQLRAAGIAKPADQATCLLTKVQEDGVLSERWWTPGKSGAKTIPAARQATVERMLLDLGWDVHGVIEQYLSTPRTDAQRLAAARVLSRLVAPRLATSQPAADAGEKQSLLAAVDALSKLSASTLASPTTWRVMQTINGAADIVADPDLWNRCKALSAKLKAPVGWDGKPADATMLGTAIPLGATFVPEQSKRVKTPYGTYIHAEFTSDQKAEELVAFFEKSVSGKFVFSPDPGAKKGAGQYILRDGKPAELQEDLDLGVRILASPDGFQEQAFGQTVRKSASVFFVGVMTKP